MENINETQTVYTTEGAIQRKRQIRNRIYAIFNGMLNHRANMTDSYHDDLVKETDAIYTEYKSIKKALSDYRLRNPLSDADINRRNGNIVINNSRAFHPGGKENNIPR